ncbi:hypothetical protein PISMIDRAFT_571961 [Pisolithus microcarpus 441]|uniref:Selenoprotein O n=1 Tax=Pisolithus microcarpus 441 TaxID=765257 RepID=A0A0C9ZEN8_9AGAM|nr:hypothetical protein BKA83DRAFT_571961 [Pisolithus microcarpus]KIK20917.1 hypothetical protein PISMIDRAFT_571961 [Pisolithus microcarpus 441]
MTGVRMHARRHQYRQAGLRVIASCGYLIPDSVSIAGLTIDYGIEGSSTKPEPVLHFVLGPYAFMYAFDPHHICNHSDQEGQYAYNVSLVFSVGPVTQIKKVQTNPGMRPGGPHGRMGREFHPDQVCSRVVENSAYLLLC